jgi:cobalt/nickel transport system permease protein
VHLADGILTHAPVAVTANALGFASVALAARHLKRSAATSTAWVGTMAAFVLALQAINVPLVPGASAHALGAGLLALTLGPARAIIALSAVLLVQALLFADGGITALGINAFNIAVLPVLCIELCRGVLGNTARTLPYAAFAGTALGSAAGAACLAATLVLGAQAHTQLTFGWLVGVQSLSGIVEGVLTAMAVRELQRRAPALLYRGTTESPWSSRTIAVAAVAMTLALVLVPFASSHPDALEVVLTHLER